MVYGLNQSSVVRCQCRWDLRRKCCMTSKPAQVSGHTVSIRYLWSRIEFIWLSIRDRNASWGNSPVNFIFKLTVCLELVDREALNLSSRWSLRGSENQGYDPIAASNIIDISRKFNYLTYCNLWLQLFASSQLSSVRRCECQQMARMKFLWKKTDKTTDWNTSGKCFLCFTKEEGRPWGG